MEHPVYGDDGRLEIDTPPDPRTGSTIRPFDPLDNGQALEQIRRIRYFEPLIAEIQENPLPPGYSAYLRKKVQQLAGHWSESVKSRQMASKGGVPGMAAGEIVQ